MRVLRNRNVLRKDMFSEGRSVEMQTKRSTKAACCTAARAHFRRNVSTKRRYVAELRPVFRAPHFVAALCARPRASAAAATSLSRTAHRLRTRNRSSPLRCFPPWCPRALLHLRHSPRSVSLMTVGVSRVTFRSRSAADQFASLLASPLTSHAYPRPTADSLARHPSDAQRARARGTNRTSAPRCAHGVSLSPVLDECQ